MLYITKKEANKVVAWVNGYPMTYADYLDNTDRQFEVIGD